jgi:hypothetical protein
MHTFAPDEKSSPVMIYTSSLLVYGELVSKDNIRVSTWLRTDSAPECLYLRKPTIVNLVSNPPKVSKYEEIYLPRAQVTSIHLTPPACDPVDYDDGEKNRIMQPVTILVGTFIFNGHLRISTRVDLCTSFVTMHSTWISAYDVKVSNPLLPRMGEVHVPMLIMRPDLVSFAL